MTITLKFDVWRCNGGKVSSRTQIIDYRGDIDGLRAVAVLSVVFFHIHAALVPGGFIGVDIFFVISGFLITKIIHKEISLGIFSFGQFYIRRIRRILPLFMLVVGATTLAGSVLLITEDIQSLASSTKYALMFGANIYFSRQRGYFDLSADEKPLLHIWSLSVEEQYYFLLPVLFVTIYAIEKYVAIRIKRNIPILAPIFIALTAIGFICAQRFLVEAGSNAKFYFLLQTRFCELLIGSAAAILPFFLKRQQTNILSTGGILLIAWALYALDKNSTFPGYNAVAPCLGTATLLYCGQGKKDRQPIFVQLLNFSPLRYVGVLSYGIYLWHWPILAFMRYIYGRYELPLDWIAAAIFFTATFSYFSYIFLEKKFNKALLSFKQAFIGIYLIPSILILIFCQLITSQSDVSKKDADLTTYGTDVCHGNFTKTCIRGDTSKLPRILMIGDSHAAALNSFIDVVGKREHWSAMVVTASSCSPVFNFDEMALPDFARTPCSNLKEFVVDHYRDYEAVFIASYWAFQLSMLNEPADKNYRSKLDNTIKRITADNIPVYVFSDIPRLPISPSRLVHFDKLGLVVSREPSRETIEANNAIRNTILSIPNAHWIDITGALENFSGNSVFKGAPIYLDDQHLNKYGSTALGEAFSTRQHIIQAPLASPESTGHSR